MLNNVLKPYFAVEGYFERYRLFLKSDDVLL
jgi:hypothetical protein